MLATVVDIRYWLHEDASRPIAQRHQRDRALALVEPALDPVAVDGKPHNDKPRIDKPRAQAARVVAWWQRLAAEPSPQRTALVARIRLALRGAPVLLGLLGAALGAGAASAGLAYDGSHPVNLIAVLMLLVGLPGVFLLLTLLLLPGRLPGLGWLQQLLASLNLGQWLTRWLSYKITTGGETVSGRDALGLDALSGWRASRSATARVGKWLMLAISQAFTIGFFVGALGALFALVSFTDLAFGWSTTLELSPQTLVGWVQTSAAPWAAWLPQAAPNAELILQSQYFRAAGAPEHAQQLGGWWPYLVMCLLIYGLLPRLLLLLLSHWRLTTATQHLLLHDPQVGALLDRLQTPWVERSISAPETDIGIGVAQPPARVALPEGRYALVIWNQVAAPLPISAWLRHLRVNLDPSTLQLSGHRAASEGLTGFTEQLAQVQHVVVVTKAWEPPLLELHDLLIALAALLQPVGRVMVLPLSLALVGRLATDADPVGQEFAPNQLGAVDERIWRQSIAALNNPKILLATSDG